MSSTVAQVAAHHGAQGALNEGLLRFWKMSSNYALVTGLGMSSSSIFSVSCGRAALPLAASIIELRGMKTSFSGMLCLAHKITDRLHAEVVSARLFFFALGLSRKKREQEPFVFVSVKEVRLQVALIG